MKCIQSKLINTLSGDASDKDITSRNTIQLDIKMAQAAK
jgi:hypothetical protein